MTVDCLFPIMMKFPSAAEHFTHFFHVTKLLAHARRNGGKTRGKLYCKYMPNQQTYDFYIFDTISIPLLFTPSIIILKSMIYFAHCRMCCWQRRPKMNYYAIKIQMTSSQKKCLLNGNEQNHRNRIIQARILQKFVLYERKLVQSRILCCSCCFVLRFSLPPLFPAAQSDEASEWSLADLPPVPIFYHLPSAAIIVTVTPQSAHPSRSIFY